MNYLNLVAIVSKKLLPPKLKEAYQVVKKPCIALDSGFFIEELNGFPKAFVNFTLDTIGIDGILELMKNKSNKKCQFKECFAYYDGETIKYFYGESKGSLSSEKQGLDHQEKWSDLWYIFIPNGLTKTLAQMTPEERENRKKIDKSSSAIEEFAKWYQKKLNN